MIVPALNKVLERASNINSSPVHAQSYALRSSNGQWRMTAHQNRWWCNVIIVTLIIKLTSVFFPVRVFLLLAGWCASVIAVFAIILYIGTVVQVVLLRDGLADPFAIFRAAAMCYNQCRCSAFSDVFQQIRLVRLKFFCFLGDSLRQQSLCFQHNIIGQFCTRR